MVNHPNRKRKIAAYTHDHDADYAALLDRSRRRLRAVMVRSFATGLELNETYLSHLGSERGVHDCSACRRFINAFGSLVAIGEDGHTTSAFWDAETVPEFYQEAVAAMAKAVERAKVIGPFLSPRSDMGPAEDRRLDPPLGEVAQDLQASAALGRSGDGRQARGLQHRCPRLGRLHACADRGSLARSGSRTPCLQREVHRAAQLAG